MSRLKLDYLIKICIMSCSSFSLCKYIDDFMFVFIRTKVKADASIKEIVKHS